MENVGLDAMKRPRESKVVEIPQKRVRDAIASRFKAGDSIALLAWDYGYKRIEIEFCIREAMKRPRRSKPTVPPGYHIQRTEYVGVKEWPRP